MPPLGIDWTPEKVAELKRRWDAGESGSEIGHAMGASRSAISGKVDRLGLSSRKVAKTAEEIEAARQKKNTGRVIRKKINRQAKRGTRMQDELHRQEPPPLPTRRPLIGALNIPFGDLRRHSSSAPNQCRYIADEPASPQYLACGNETAPGESWCAHCRRIVFRTAQNITDEDRARRAAHFRKLGYQPQAVTLAPINEEAA